MKKQYGQNNIIIVYFECKLTEVLMLKFGEYIKSKRLEKGISLRELASKVGISPSYISDI